MKYYLKTIFTVFMIVVLLCSCSKKAENDKQINTTTTNSEISSQNQTATDKTNQNYSQFIAPPSLSENYQWKEYFSKKKNDDLFKNDNTDEIDYGAICASYISSYVYNSEFIVSHGTYGDFNYSLYENGYISVDKYNGYKTSIDIPCEINEHKVAYIGEDCFRNHILLQKVNIPDGLVFIGTGAFFNCKSLRDIQLNEGLLYIGNNSFSCSGLKNLYIPDSVLAINTFAFEGCRSLKTVHLGSSLQYTDGYIFSACTSLESINIPDSLNCISIGMFQGCSKLSKITVPQSVKSIESKAFINCYSLKSIELSKDVILYDYYGSPFNTDIEIIYY